MKKLLLFMFAVVAFAACEQAPIEEQSVIRPDAPDTITVGFEGDDTRIQLNEVQKTVWTKGDLVSVFYKSDANQKYEYRGETGERTAELHKVSAGSSTTKMGYVVVAYPYNEEYIISPATGNLETMLPAVQHYAVDSYGVGDNLMVSCSEFTQFSLKSVCGWLKLQLTGNGEVVKGIKFRGNNGEQVAGLIHVDTKSAEATLYSEEVAPDDNGNANGSLVIDGAMATEVMLYCDEGVTLSSETTAFYIALPPQTFEEGFTVDIECDGYKPMTLSTTNTLTIERNHIQPMASVEHDASPIVPNNQIWYTSYDGNVVERSNTNAFGANIISNTYNNGKGVIIFDGDVTTIGEDAFWGCTSLTSVNIPDSVTTIGESAFYECESLTSVNIPDSVTEIGDNAFEDCRRLTRVTIPDSVTTIGDRAFIHCHSLTSVNIGNGVTTIGEYAFYYCASLTSVTIPDSVTEIGVNAFLNCASLTSVTIGDSVTTIGNSAFSSCASLTSVTIGDSVTTIGNSAFSSCASLTSVTIPDSVTSIGEGAFWSCDSLTSVTIGDSVTTIGESAFRGCSSLTSVTIPDSVTSIGDEAFAYCSSLTEFKGTLASEDGRCLIVDGILNSFAPGGLTEYTIPDSVTSIGDEAFAYCSSLTSVTIGNSVTEIGDYAFYSCASLTSVIIGDSVTSIGDYAFAYCTSLTSVTIGDSVTMIRDYAFYGCTSLTSVTIGDSVTMIRDYAFYGCTSLTSVIIGDSVTMIRKYAFRDCDSLTSVYCKATTPPSFGEYAVFDSIVFGRKIYVPTESVNAYRSAYGWSQYASYIVGYDF